MRHSSAVKTVFHKPSDVEIPLKEVGRYMGLGRSQPDAQLGGLMEKALADFQKAANYTACFMEVPVFIAEAKTDFGTFCTEGKSLAKHLAGCDRAILFAATTGIETERQRKRAFVTSPSLALVLDAVGTAAIESFCDLLCREWAEEHPGQTFRSRFSPGYGDLPLNAQKPLLDALHANQNAGISLTDALLMIPQKSVSAIIGMEQTDHTAEKPAVCSKRDHCPTCGQQDCTFRL